MDRHYAAWPGDSTVCRALHYHIMDRPSTGVARAQNGLSRSLLLVLTTSWTVLEQGRPGDRTVCPSLLRHGPSLCSGGLGRERSVLHHYVTDRHRTQLVRGQTGPSFITASNTFLERSWQGDRKVCPSITSHGPVSYTHLTLPTRLSV